MSLTELGFPEFCQVRNTRLERVEAIVEREQRALTKGNDHGFLLRSMDGRVGLARPHRGIFDGCALTPFSHRLNVKVITLGHARYALMTTTLRD